MMLLNYNNISLYYRFYSTDQIQTYQHTSFQIIKNLTDPKLLNGWCMTRVWTKIEHFILQVKTNVGGNQNFTKTATILSNQENMVMTALPCKYVVEYNAM